MQGKRAVIFSTIVKIIVLLVTAIVIMYVLFGPEELLAGVSHGADWIANKALQKRPGEDLMPRKDISKTMTDAFYELYQDFKTVTSEESGCIFKAALPPEEEGRLVLRQIDDDISFTIEIKKGLATQYEEDQLTLKNKRLCIVVGMIESANFYHHWLEKQTGCKENKVYAKLNEFLEASIVEFKGENNINVDGTDYELNAHRLFYAKKFDGKDYVCLMPWRGGGWNCMWGNRGKYELDDDCFNDAKECGIATSSNKIPRCKEG